MSVGHPCYLSVGHPCYLSVGHLCYLCQWVTLATCVSGSPLLLVSGSPLLCWLVTLVTCVSGVTLVVSVRSLSNKVQLPSMKTVQPVGLNLQLANGGGSSHPCWIASRGDSQTTCHHPHRFNEFATKSEKWNGKPRL